MKSVKKHLPTILIVLGIIVVVGFVVWALAKPDNSSSQTAQTTDQQKQQMQQGHSTGNTNAKVVVVEFGDYQCPICGQWYPYLKNTLMPQYGDKINFVFKNFPLTQVHKNAQIAAQAAEAAGLQNKFWEMHDALYDHQQDWSEQSDPTGLFIQYAQSIGLNVDQFKSDLNSQKVKDIVNTDAKLATDMKLQGTPTFFVNGQPVTITTGFDDLKHAVDQALGQ